MKTHSIRTIVLISLVFLSLGVGLTQAQGPEPGQKDPAGVQAVLAPLAQLGPSFTYQGYLEKDGSPVNGQLCDFIFTAWDASSNGNKVGSNMLAMSVLVEDGRFTRELNTSGELGSYPFNGKALYLEVSVRCPAGFGSYVTLDGRQKLTAAPYAQSLIPGAVISNTASAPALKLWTNSGQALVVNSLGGGSGSYGVYAATNQTDGTGVYGEALGGPEAYGVWGRSNIGRGVVGGSDTGIGVYGWTSGGIDVMAGGTGVISSVADSVIQINPMELVVRSDSTNTTVTYTSDAEAWINNASGTGEKYYMVPVQIPGQLYKAPLYVKSVTICYTAGTAGTQRGYITVTAVGKKAFQGSPQWYVLDTTDRLGNVSQCYTSSAATPRKPIDAKTWVQFNVAMEQAGQVIRIDDIQLTLTELQQ
jgi:hypothetical protein